MNLKKILNLRAYRDYYTFRIRKKVRSNLVNSYTKLGRIRRRVRYKEHDLLFRCNNYSEFRRPENSYKQGNSEIYWIENFIGPDEVVFDVGACIGTFTVLIGKIMQSRKGKGMVYAFEPESQNFASLNRNIHLNGLTNVLAFPIGFGGGLRAERFFVQTFEPGFAAHALHEPVSSGREFRPQYVQGMIEISLDQFVGFENIRFPDHIKIDVDGLERTIVANMGKVLEDPRLKTVHIEVNENIDRGDIPMAFGRAGFEEVYRQEDPPGEKIFNVLFVRKGLKAGPS